MVIGRGTYEKVLTFDSWPYKEKRVVVLSTTLGEGQDSNVTVARDVQGAVEILDERKRAASTSMAARSSRPSSGTISSTS